MLHGTENVSIFNQEYFLHKKDWVKYKFAFMVNDLITASVSFVFVTAIEFHP